MVPSKRLIETNHLIIRENETRNVGVVQHNHTVIEKELILTKRNVDTKTVNTQVNLVEHKYNTERKRVVEEREIPGAEPRPSGLRLPGPKKSVGVQAYGKRRSTSVRAIDTARSPRAAHKKPRLTTAGYRTAPLGNPRGGSSFGARAMSDGGSREVVQQGGFEPPTSGSTDRRSNQLSYCCTGSRRAGN